TNYTEKGTDSCIQSPESLARSEGRWDASSSTRDSRSARTYEMQTKEGLGWIAGAKCHWRQSRMRLPLRQRFEGRKAFLYSRHQTLIRSRGFPRRGRSGLRCAARWKRRIRREWFISPPSERRLVSPTC